MSNDPAAAPEPTDPAPDSTESTLVRRAQEGDREAFGALVLRWQDRCLALARRRTGDRDDAEEVAQETFLRAWRALDTFDPERDFGPWLLTICANLVRDRGRRLARRGPRRHISDPAAALPGDAGADPAPPPWRDAAAREARDALHRALERLTPEQAETFSLFHLEGCTVKETARRLGATEGAVKVRLHRVRERLRDDLRRAGVELPGTREH